MLLHTAYTTSKNTKRRFFESISAAQNRADAWYKFFQNEHVPNLMKLLQYVLSIPVYDAATERMFSLIKDL